MTFWSRVSIRNVYDQSQGQNFGLDCDLKAKISAFISADLGSDSPHVYTDALR